MNAPQRHAPLPDWVKAILREKYPRPDPLAEAMKGIAEAVEAFGKSLAQLLSVQEVKS